MEPDTELELYFYYFFTLLQFSGIKGERNSECFALKNPLIGQMARKVASHHPPVQSHCCKLMFQSLLKYWHSFDSLILRGTRNISLSYSLLAQGLSDMNWILPSPYQLSVNVNFVNLKNSSNVIELWSFYNFLFMGEKKRKYKIDNAVEVYHMKEF